MNHKNPSAVEDAIKVYDSMFRPESNIKPSIIHSNAIINCLGRALNMDALWSVAGRLPEGGPGSADKWTYTTILNTMQACAVRDAAQLEETDGDQEAAARLVQSAIAESRKLWEDIISRWRCGDINIDQTLVCAMGRLLLLGQKRDWDDIFSLVEQTMLVPRVKSPILDRQSQENDELEKALALPLPDKDDGSSGLPLPHEEDGSSGLEQLELAVADEAAPRVKNEFAVVDLSGRLPRRMNNNGGVPSPYANVGNNALSLLLEAAIKLRAIPVGKTYWERLTKATDDKAVVMPDEDNLHSYLRLLRLSRSSKEICDVLRQPVSAALEGVWYRRGTFVIAMSTCARDFKNPNVFSHASAILDLMQAKLAQPDLKVMRMYLSLAAVTTPGVSNQIPGVFDASAGENNLIKALRRFSYSDLNFQTIMSEWIQRNVKRGEDQDQLYVGESIVQRRRRLRRAHEAQEPPRELVGFLQDLNSAYDTVLKFRLKMTEKLANSLSQQKRELSADLQLLNADPLSMPISEPKEEDDDLSSVRLPDKLAKSARLVDVDKIHPFQRDLNEKGRSKQGTGRDWESKRSARDGGQSDEDLRTAIFSSSDTQGSGKDSRSAPSSRGSREGQWPGREAGEGARGGGRGQWPDGGFRSKFNRADRQWAKSLGRVLPREGRQEGNRLGRQDGHAASTMTGRRDQQGTNSAPMSGGWDKAWKQSVEKMGGEERRKDWVVV
jgi:hypothetical protein